MEKYDLYWIKEASMTDPYTQGYIGITKRGADTRVAEHLKEKNLENVEHVVLHSGAEKYISDLEHQYRPESFIGWNKSPGGLTGGRPKGIHTSGWTHSEESRKKRSELFKGSGNGMYGKKQSDKQKESVSKAAIRTHKGKPKNYKVINPVLFGSDNPRARRIHAEGTIYNTIKECQEAFGFKNHNTIRYRLNHDKWTEWYYLD